jgi:hypothetical protein
VSSKDRGSSKRYQPNAWTERLVPAILILLLVILVATIVFVILTMF